ncbi:MAG: hypothetical protein ACPGUD_08670 [Parashewanella sp.]
MYIYQSSEYKPTSTLTRFSFQTTMLFLVCCAFFSSAEASNTVTPMVVDVFSQKMQFNLPAKWKQVHNEKLVDMISSEYIPENESMKDWRQLICLQGFDKISEDLDAETFLETMAKTYTEHCQGDVVFEPMGKVAVDGMQGFHAILGCTKMPNIHTVRIGKLQTFVSPTKGEIGYYAALKAKDKLILFHKSTRDKVFSLNNSPLTPENYSAYIKSVISVKQQ